MLVFRDSCVLTKWMIPTKEQKDPEFQVSSSPGVRCVLDFDVLSFVEVQSYKQSHGWLSTQ